MSRFVFRVDSSQKIGSGHVMRCLILAEELRECGASVEFIVRDHKGNINQQIISKGFMVNSLPTKPYKTHQALTNYEAWLGVGQNLDSDETISIIEDKAVEWLIVDHYAIDYRWERKLRPHIKKIMVIDDLANRRHDCDLLLDQNYIHNEKRYDQLVAPDVIKLLGVRYVLLRKEFIKNIDRVQNSKVKRVFVFFGAIDQDNLTLLAIKSLTQPNLKHILVDIVIGEANPYQKELRETAAKFENISLHIQISNIAELMLKADLALGAGGVTTWERIVLGLPSIVVTIADNQVGSVKALDERGYISWLGDSNQVDEQIMCNAILRVINNGRKLQEQSQKCKQLFNVKGVMEIADFLLNGIDQKTLSVREAQLSDLLLYWHWVNDPVVRKNAFNENIIKWQEHQKWFDKKLNDSSSILLLIESSVGPIGQVRFDKVESGYEIDYSLGKQFRGFGVAKAMLSKAINYVREENISTLTAKVKVGNIASKKVFQYLGFTELSISKKDVVTNYQLQIN